MWRTAGRSRRMARSREDLAETIALLKLRYVVVTSVDRDDLRDGGAAHFVDCIQEFEKPSPATTIEVLVPDFREPAGARARRSWSRRRPMS